MLRFWLVLLCLCSSLACATPQDEDLAYSLGAKLGEPGRPVVSLMGDGGLQFTLPELASAVTAEMGAPAWLARDAQGQAGARPVQQPLGLEPVAQGQPLAGQIGVQIGVGRHRCRTPQTSLNTSSKRFRASSITASVSARLV